MVKILIFTLGSFGFTFLLAPFIINLLYRLKIREEIRQEGPASHLVKEGTPTMAGILIVTAVTLINLVFNLSRSETYLPIFTLVLAGGLGIVEDAFKIYRKSLLTRLLGLPPWFRDWGRSLRRSRLEKIILIPWSGFKEIFRSLGSKDTSGLKSYQKFLLQAGIGVFLALWFYFKLERSSVWMPLIGNQNLSFGYPFLVVFVFTFFLNSVGVTDGLDGLAGGLLSLLFLSLGAIALNQNQLGIALFCASIVGSLLAFLYFNFYPARVFMGNVGAYALGAAASVVAMLLHKEIILFVLGGVFIVELFSVILQVLSVKISKKRIFRMAPLHHHFELLGWPETKVTMRFWLAGIVFSLIGLLVSQL